MVMFEQQMEEKLLGTTNSVMEMLDRRDTFLRLAPEDFIRNAVEWRRYDSDATVSVEEVEYIYEQIKVDTDILLVFRRLEKNYMSISNGELAPKVMRSKMLDYLHCLVDELQNYCYLLRQMYNAVEWMQKIPGAPDVLRDYVRCIAGCEERCYDILQHAQAMIKCFSESIESPPRL